MSGGVIPWHFGEQMWVVVDSSGNTLRYGLVDRWMSSGIMATAMENLR